MGSLELPRSGRIYLDTAAIIYGIEEPTRWSVLKPLWQLAIEGTITVVVSELALLEVLTGPMKHQNSALIASYEKLFESPQLQVRPIDRIVLRAAAELRASIPALRTPDAIHAATASLENCVRFITNDKGFRRLPQLSVLLLDELISP
jgi:predicted nucleic acid-binding protein